MVVDSQEQGQQADSAGQSTCHTREVQCEVDPWTPHKGERTELTFQGCALAFAYVSLTQMSHTHSRAHT